MAGMSSPMATSSASASGAVRDRDGWFGIVVWLMCFIMRVVSMICSRFVRLSDYDYDYDCAPRENN